jgi:hypothetical protein
VKRAGVDAEATRRVVAVVHHRLGVRRHRAHGPVAARPGTAHDHTGCRVEELRVNADRTTCVWLPALATLSILHTHLERLQLLIDLVCRAVDVAHPVRRAAVGGVQFLSRLG